MLHFQPLSRHLAHCCHFSWQERRKNEFHCWGDWLGCSSLSWYVLMFCLRRLCSSQPGGKLRWKFLLKVYKLNPTTSTKKIKDMNNLTNDFTNKQSSILLLVLEMIQCDKERKSHFWFVFPCFHCQVITIIINSRKYFQKIELQPFCEASKARITSSKSNFLPKCRGFFKVPYDILI